MNLEDYLIEEKSSILAINRISQILYNYIGENYYNFGKDISYLNELHALVVSIQMIAFVMRIRRKEYYKQIDNSYNDYFTYDTVMYEEI